MISRIKLGQTCYHLFHALAPMTAREMNFFIDEGLVNSSGRSAVETLAASMVPYNAEKVALVQAMKERSANASVDVKPSTVVYLNRRGANLRIVGGWMNQQPGWLMSKAEIRDLADLRGRVVGLKDFDVSAYYGLAYRLKEAGLDPKGDVQYTRGVSEGQVALRSGEVDAAFVRAEERSAMADEGFNVLLDPREQYPNGRPERVVVVTDDLLRERPEWVGALMRGLIRAYWFMRTMPENFMYMNNLERRMRLRPVLDAGVPLPNPDTSGNERRARMRSFDPEECQLPPNCRTPASCEQLPFPLDGMPTGFEDYMREWVALGEIDQEDVETLKDSLRLDVAKAAYADLEARPELQPELARMRELQSRIGY